MDNLRRREQAYGRFFGGEFTVSHELLPREPHIDVYMFGPVEGEREFDTLVTGGMSDLPMNVPDGLPIRRVELVLYADEPRDEYVNLLRWLAHLVHDQRTWISPGSTMTNGDPPEPIFDGSLMDCFAFLQPLLAPDYTFSDELEIDGDPVFLLWVVPITSSECEFLRTQGLETFYELLEQNEHSLLLEEDRQPYV